MLRNAPGATLSGGRRARVRRNDCTITICLRRPQEKPGPAGSVALIAYEQPGILLATCFVQTLPIPRVPPSLMTIPAERRRSVAFVDDGEQMWACFLVTFSAEDGRWHGYFSFRPGHGEADEDDVRTTDIFVEASEAEIYEKARGLGRPLLAGLLESAVHTSRRNGRNPRLRGRFRTLLTENAVEIAGAWTDEAPTPTVEERERLRSLYASYRLDQVAHLICLVEPEAFEQAVDDILGAEKIDFLSRDRLQYAMMVVDHIERLLPLPDFDTWAADFLAHPDAYRLYTHTLHREGRLP